MYRKVFVILLAVIFAGLFLTACTTAQESTEATTVEEEVSATETNEPTEAPETTSLPVTISMAHFSLPDSDVGTHIALRNGIEKFENDYPNVTLEQDISPSDSYLTKIKTIAAGNSLPDVFYVNGSMMQSFSDSGLMMPLNDILEADSEWTDCFVEGSFDEFTKNNNIYGIPIQRVVTHVIFYNKEIFEECGITEFPKDWNSLLEAAQTISAKGYIPMALGNKEQWVIESCFFSTLADRITGTDWFYSIKNKTGEAKFTDPEFVAALQTLQDLTQSGFFNNDAQGIDRKEALQLYMDKQAAMYVEGAWGIGTVNKNVPEDVLNVTELAILPGGVPSQKGEDNKVSGGAGWAIGVSANISDSQKEAVTELLKYLVNTDTSIDCLENGGQPVCKVDISSFELDPLTSKYYTLLEGYEFTPIYDIQLEASLVDIVYRGLQEVMIGQTTPEDLAAKLQTEQEVLMGG